MALFRKFFYRKPPDGLLEISERVHVFDCCFTTDIWEGDDYKVYIGGIVSQLRDYLPDASFMVFNFREGENQSQISSILSEYDMTVMDYPRQYEGCPLLTMEMIHHFLRSSESWLTLAQQNVLLMHCERGGWPVLAFMLAALLIYRKQFSGEQKTLDMVYKQAPRELVQLMSPLNPLPSQLRYLQYVSRRNVGSEWPPLDRALTLDCVILRVIPNLDGKGGCCPIFRIYGPDPLMVADRIPKVLYSTPKTSKLVRHYKQADCELVKIDINCHIQGDVVLECINLDGGQEREQMMFRVVFNTAFIRSNILILNRDEIDILWDAKDQFAKDFRAEVLFSEMDSTPLASIDLPSLEEKDGLPADAFAKVHEIFSILDWSDARTDLALNALQQITTQQDNFDSSSKKAEVDRGLLESTLEKILEKPDLSEAKSKIQNPASTSPRRELVPPFKPYEDTNLLTNKIEPQELKDALQCLLSNKSPDSIREKYEPQYPHKLRDPIQLVPSKLPVDAKSVGSKAEQQEPHISLQRPLQSKIISQRLPQSSISSPVSHSNSVQGSPVSISRYHSVPSALGITALLHDHAASSVGDGFPSTLPLPSSAVSSSVKILPSQLTSVSTKSTPPPPPPPVPPCPSLRCSTEAATSLERLSLSPPMPAEPVTKAADSFINQNPKVSVATVQSLSVPPLPPSLSGSSTSSVKRASPGSLSTSNFPTSFSDASELTTDRKPPLAPPPPPPPHSSSGTSPSSDTKKLSSAPPPPPPPRVDSVPPPPPPPHSGSALVTPSSASVPPPPPPPGPVPKESPCNKSPHVPPPPPAPLAKSSSKANEASLPSHSVISNGSVPPVPGPPSGSLLGAKGQGLSRPGSRIQGQTRKANLKPYHWLKLTRAMQGSLWAEAQKPDEASKAPEFDIKELESLFSAAAPNSDHGSKGGKPSGRVMGPKSDKVQLIELRRAYNCEIMLSKVKIPLPDLMNSILTLDDSGLDVDQIDNLIKFCPTKEEMELLKGYNGDKENLGKCEKFFLQLMQVPRVESKLRVFSFKLQFHPQVSDLRRNLNIINSTAEEVRNSVKLKRIMQTILSLGNALNQGTARGSAVGFRLDSLLKLTDTRARNGKMTLMHYLCKVLAEKLPDLLDFPKDLVSLESATKVQLKYLAEEMQAISKGLERVVQELTASENDGPVSEIFCKSLKAFLVCAESEVRSLASLYSSVGRNADALAFYFGEDPARCPFEQVVSTLLNFVRMFVRAHNENCKQLEYEKKKAAKVAENEKLKTDASKMESGKIPRRTVDSGNPK